MFIGLGDPARMIAGQTGDKATLENIRKELYLDQPAWKQYLYYLNDVSPLAFHHRQSIQQKGLHGIFIGKEICFAVKWPYLRKSYQSRKSVADVLMDALPGTLLLAFTAMLIAIIFGIGLGVTAAARKGTFPDRFCSLISVAGISAPSFFMALLMAFVFGWVLSDYTGLHITGSMYEVDARTGDMHLELRNLILPAFTLGIRPMAIIAQLTRSSMLDVLSSDYIRTAYAKGLSERRVLWRHALPNALNPVITAITGWFAELLAGSFFIEFIFGWKGVGKVTVDALEKLDYPVVLGSVMLTAFLFVLINVLSDFLYRLFDPRMRGGI
jgi:peptide/nickel transport system permease protein